MATSAQAALGRSPLPAAAPQARQRGAYAVINDSEGRVLVIRAANGRCYLPGGRIEPGETARAALVREIAEECAWSAQIGQALGSALQPIMNNEVTVDASYWRVRLVAPLAGEAEHATMWLQPSEALHLLHRHGDAAAVRKALS